MGQLPHVPRCHWPQQWHNRGGSPNHPFVFSTFGTHGTLDKQSARLYLACRCSALLLHVCQMGTFVLHMLQWRTRTHCACSCDHCHAMPLLTLGCMHMLHYLLRRFLSGKSGCCGASVSCCCCCLRNCLVSRCSDWCCCSAQADMV